MLRCLSPLEVLTCELPKQHAFCTETACRSSLHAGGFLAQAYGWSAPFIALLVFAAGIILPATLLLVKETQQYITLKRLSPAEAATIKEAPQLLSNPPRFGSPWAPIVAVCDRRVVLHLVQSTVGFACMLSAQVELPGQLAAPPYRLAPSMIGVAMIATGGAGMIASPLGGKLFDRGADKCPQPMFRLTVNTLASLIGELCRSLGRCMHVDGLQASVRDNPNACQT